ncbi:hypothetical protein LOD99_14765 [Oopsacas minuta]|uniref:Zinc-binding domain-containing protein n=1 Tax=Oopsacas minuta TaxID=111878 RepID=A0AAV7KG83_9METZ|nr:hypothetical protein LOD99_14765 [Oopsacas minuta]
MDDESTEMSDSSEDHDHDYCLFVPYMEIHNVEFDWWHKDRDPCRFFGRFQCDECPNKWTSAWTWLGRGHKCRECVYAFGWHSVEYTLPYEVEPRMRNPPPRLYGPIGPRRNQNHLDYKNCEFCAEICGSTTKIPKDRKCNYVNPGNPFSRAYRQRRRKHYS